MIDMRKFFFAFCFAWACTTTTAAADWATEFQAGLSAYEAQNYQEAAQVLIPLAVEGDPRAQYMIGIMYAKGKGVPKDRCISTIWTEKSARQGNSNAALLMAFTFRIGGGVRQSDEMAYRWASYAHKLGHSEAYDLLPFMAGDLNADQIATIEASMRTWDPSKISATEYFFFDADILGLGYSETIKRTNVQSCR